jgi:hypothetical protein
MTTRQISQQPATSPAASDLGTRLAELPMLDADALRRLWRQTVQRPLPAALTRDMQLRMIAYRLQEQQLGGLPPDHRKLLDRLVQGGRADDVRRLKPGSVLVREYQGVVHEVSVEAEGFRWQGNVHASLSSIAKAITGTAWNGPRFFGLRGATGTAGNAPTGTGNQGLPPPSPPPTPRRGRRGAIQPRAT